jgi:tRNA-dihydrouridine synthase
MWSLAALLAALVLMTISTSMGLRSAARSLRMVSSNAGAEASNVHAFSIAPMMEYTDAHQRKLIRLITARSVLYTEMVTANALVRTDTQERFLEADFQKEDPVVLQLGGGDPQLMADAAKIAYDYGYKEFNINCGCPSEKVAGAGCFGAALMLNPAVVADLTSAISEVSGKPTSVKCRIGVNDDDSYEQLHRFVETVSARGNVDHFVVHARKALLGGKFSPADNRKIPPLKYQYVYRLVQDFPHLAFTLNGGVVTMEHTERIFTGRVPEADLTVDGSSGSSCNDGGGDGNAMASSSSSSSSLLSHPPRLAGVMVGRAVVDKPFHWGRVDSTLYVIIRYIMFFLFPLFVLVSLSLSRSITTCLSAFSDTKWHESNHHSHPSINY